MSIDICNENVVKHIAVSWIYWKCIERYMHYFVKLYLVNRVDAWSSDGCIKHAGILFHKGHSVLNCIILVYTFCKFIWLIMYIYLIVWSNCIKLCNRFVLLEWELIV